MSNESGVSFVLCSLRWRVMEEENEEERYERKGMSEREGRYRESLGAFLEYFKFFEVFFLKTPIK